MKKIVPNKEPIKLSDGSMIVNGELKSSVWEGDGGVMTVDEFEMGLLEMVDVVEKKLIRNENICAE